MIFNVFKSRIPPIDIPVTWLVGYGSINLSNQDVSWHDDKVTIIAPHRTVAFSNNQRFVAVGDVWLSNRGELHKGEDSRNSDIQLIVQLWEKRGVESLKLLEGMFWLVVWDREKKVLKLVRDITG